MDACHEQERVGKRLAYKINEAAELLGLHPNSIRNAIADGRLRVSRRFRHMLIPAQELERFLEEGMVR